MGTPRNQAIPKAIDHTGDEEWITSDTQGKKWTTIYSKVQRTYSYVFNNIQMESRV